MVHLAGTSCWSNLSYCDRAHVTKWSTTSWPSWWDVGGRTSRRSRPFENRVYELKWKIKYWCDLGIGKLNIRLTGGRTMGGELHVYTITTLWKGPILSFIYYFDYTAKLHLILQCLLITLALGLSYEVQSWEMTGSIFCLIYQKRFILCGWNSPSFPKI